MRKTKGRKKNAILFTILALLCSYADTAPLMALEEPRGRRDIDARNGATSQPLQLRGAVQSAWATGTMRLASTNSTGGAYMHCTVVTTLAYALLFSSPVSV